MRPGRPITHSPRLVSIQTKVPASQNSLGEASGSWKTIAQAWTIDWQTLSGQETFGGEQVKATADAIITIRYMASVPVLPDMQLLYGGRSFSINAALNVNEQNQYLRLICKETPAEA